MALPLSWVMLPIHEEASAMLCLCLKGNRSNCDSEPPKVEPPLLATFPIQEMLQAAALLTPSPMDTTFLITGTSDQAAAATPAVATPAVGSTLRRISGFAGTAAKALVAGRAICSKVQFRWRET